MSISIYMRMEETPVSSINGVHRRPGLFGFWVFVFWRESVVCMAGRSPTYAREDILQAQKWLRNLGSKIKVTGDFTIGMTTAICSFQRKHGLDITGELDGPTWDALRKENGFWRRLKRRFHGSL